METTKSGEFVLSLAALNQAECLSLARPVGSWKDEAIVASVTAGGYLVRNQADNPVLTQLTWFKNGQEYSLILTAVDHLTRGSVNKKLPKSKVPRDRRVIFCGLHN